VKIKINPEIFTAHAQPFTPQESAAPERISDMRSLSLIGQKLREEMTTYAGMLRDHFTSLKDSAGVPAHFQLMAKTLHIAERMEELAKLSELQESNRFASYERIYLYSLTNQLLSQISSSSTHPIEWIVDPAGAMLAPVFGDKAWLTLALRAYFKKLAEGASDNASNAGLIGRCQSNTSAAAQVAGQRQPTQAAEPVFDLSLQLADRVLELHGATVTVQSQPDRTHLESVRITFPTSSPQTTRPDVWCDNCPAAKQSAAFARDIATLTRVKNHD
jgi:hypothetical protein